MHFILRTSSLLKSSLAKYNPTRFNLKLVRSIYTKDLKINNNSVFLYDSYKQFKFNELICLTHRLKDSILDARNTQDLNGENIAVLCSNNYLYFVSVLAIWLANGVPVPLNKTYSPNFLAYFLKDSKSTLIVNGVNAFDNSNASNEQFLSQQNIPTLQFKDEDFYKKWNHEQMDGKYCVKSFFREINLSKSNHKNGLILYTSGSSGPSKGVVLTYSNLVSQIESLVECWKLKPGDNVLNVLPLNHVHGLVYSLLAPFCVGAQVNLLPKFDAETTWHKLVDEKNAINIMTAVINQLAIVRLL